MRICTLRNITAAFATILSLLAGGFAADAQTVYKCVYNGDGATISPGWSETNSAGAMCTYVNPRVIIDGSTVNASSRPGFPLPTALAGYRVPQSITVFSVTKNAAGAEVLDTLDYIDSKNTTDGISPNRIIGSKYNGVGFVRYQASTPTHMFGVNMTSTSRMSSLLVVPEYRETYTNPATGKTTFVSTDDFQGKTLLVRMCFGTTASGVTRSVVDCYFDMIGSKYHSDITSTEDQSPTNVGDDGDTWRYFTPCPNDPPVEMKLTGKEFPYGEEPSFLGNTYSVKYVWKLVSDGWNRGKDIYVTDRDVDSKSYTDATVTQQEISGMAEYKPIAVIYRNGKNTGCEVETEALYDIYLDQPLETYNGFENMTSGATDAEFHSADSAKVDRFYACYGDDVKYTPSFRQDIEGDIVDLSSNVYWAIFRLDAAGNVVDTLQNFQDYVGGDGFLFKELKETTSFKVVSEYFDDDGINLGSQHRDGKIEEHPCPTVNIFTIEVRQVSATAAITLPSQNVCEESDAEISAKISNLPVGDKPADYAYRWYYSDDAGATYNNLNTSDWLKSGDEGWSDPTATVKTVMKDVVYPTAGSGNKYVKFLFANTYKVDGQTYYCQISKEDYFPVYHIPVLEKNDDVIACLDQPVSFQVRIDDYTALPENPELGMTYQIYKDTVDYASARDIVVPIYGRKDGEGRNAGVANDDYNVNRRGSTGEFMWWAVQKVHPTDDTGKYKFYTTVKNEGTTCVSHPVETVINVKQLPVVKSVTPKPISFCLNCDPSELEVKAALTSAYLSSIPEGVDADVRYHWNWYYPSNSPIDSALISSSTLSERFSDKRLTTYVGNVLFTVFATDNNNCGYQLNFDGTIKTNTDGSYSLPAVQYASDIVKINPKPDFSIELPTDVVCGNNGKAVITVKSNDSRTVKFDFTPKGDTKVVSTNSPVTVSGYSSAEFIVNFNEADIDNDQVFEFDYSAVDADNSEQTCDSTSSIKFIVNERPQLSPITDPVKICYNQGQKFSVNFADNIPITDSGLRYWLSTDIEGNSVVPNVTPVSPVDATRSKSAEWTVDDTFISSSFPSGGSFTLYAWVTDLKTGCKSDPQPIVFVVIPQPVVDNITFSKDAFCRNADVSDLVVTANVSSAYTSFKFADYGLQAPKVDYHWSWANGKAESAKSSVISDDNKLTGDFSGLTSEVSTTSSNGKRNPLFTVYVTDNYGCGYVLDKSGVATSEPVRKTDASLTVNALPYPYIQSDVTACANDGSASVRVGSNDNRGLVLTFAPQSPNSLTASTTVNVAANSSNELFVAKFENDDISDITTFVYDVHAADYYPGCSMDTILSFTVYPTPRLSFSPADDKRFVCQGSDIVFTVSPSIKENGRNGSTANYSYQWSVDGVASSTTNSMTWSAPEDATVGLHNVSCTVTYRFSDGHECSTTESLTVFVNPRPMIAFNPDVTICEGGEATLTGSVSNGYDQNNFGRNNTFTPTVSPSLAGSKLYDFVWEYKANPVRTTEYSFSVVNDVTGCQSVAPAKAKVTVDRKAHFRVTGLSQTELCAGNYDIEVSISAVNPDEFSSVDWSSLAAAGFTVVSASDTKIVLNGNLTAGTVTIGKSNLSAKTLPGCEVVFDNDVNITVREIPDAPVIAYFNSTNGKEWVCKGQNQQITYRVTNPVLGQSYEWFVSPTEPAADAVPAQTTQASSPRFTVNTSSLTSDTYIWVRAVGSRYSTKCQSEFSSYKLKVEPVPEPSFSVDEICEGEHGVINITAPIADTENSFTYSFFSNNNTTSPLQQGESRSYTTPALTTSTLYFISVKNDATGCASPNTQVRVIVNRKPVGHASVSYQDSEGNTVITDPFGKTINRAAFCEGETGKAIVRLSPTMQSSGSTFTSTLVSVSSGSVSDWSKDTESQWSCASTKVWNEECTLTFSVKDSGTGCESDNFTATVIVKPGLPAPAIAINDEAKEVCYDVDTQINLSLSSPYVYPSTTVAFAYYLVDKATGTVLAGPLASRDGNYSSSTSELNIKSDVGFYAYAYDAASGCLSPVSNTVDIKVNPLPVPTVSVSADRLCPGESATLTVIEDFEEYYWLDGQTQGLTTKSVNVTLTSSSSFRVRVTDSKGCVSKPVESSITVFPKPSFHLEAVPASVCQGSTEEVVIKVVTENNSLSGVVFDDNSYVFTTVAPSTGVVTKRTNPEGEVEFVVTGHVWTEATESFRATVRSTGAFNSCLSDEETVTVYVVGALPKPEALAPSPQDGTLTDHVHICTGSTEPLTVSVVNKSAYPTAGNVKYSYHWYSDSEGHDELTDDDMFSVDHVNGTITFIPNASVNLYVKAVRETEPFCASELSNAFRVTIEPLPAAPAVDDANPKYVCQPEMEGSDVQLLIHNPATDNIYHWYRAADDFELGTASGTEPFVIKAPTTTTSYYARTESVYGCISPDKSQPVEVRVGSNPEIVEVNKPKSDICSGEAVFMSVSVSGDKEGVTYVYEVTSSNPLSTLAGAGTIDGSGVLTTPQLHVTDTETLTYTIRAVFAGACYSLNTVVYNVTVHGNPSVDEIVATPNPICEAEEFEVAVNNIVSHDGSLNFNSVKLVDANGNVIVSRENLSSGAYLTFFITKNLLSSGLTRDMLPLYVQIEDENCAVSKVVDIVMNDIPEFAIESKKGGLDVDGAINFCRNDTILLDLVNPLPDHDSQGNVLKYEYQWYKDDVPVGGAVQPAFSIINAEPSASGVYTLEVKSFRGVVEACSYSRSISVIVNELPDAIIDGDNINGYYCTDGDLDLFGNEGMIKYEWTVDSNPKFTLTKTEGDADFDNRLVKKLADLNVNSDGNFGVHLVVTDKFGCRSMDGYADIFTAVPPVISSVAGVEACKDKPFVITVEQNRADYDLSLYESDGVTPVPDYSYDFGSHSLTTSTDLDEGDYVLRVKDVDSQCTTDTLIHLAKYDIEPAFKLIPDPSNRFYCYNGLVAFDISLEENNGHDDFFEKIEDVKIELNYTFQGVTVHYDAPVTLSQNLLHVEFAPNDPLYGFTPSDYPYSVRANFSYKFKSDVNGYLSCDNYKDQNLRIVEVPVLRSEPAMPLCLDEPVKFIVDMDNIGADTADQKFIFYVNGVQVVNADGVYSSNEFDSADHPEISLSEGDQVTAEVVMDVRGNICTSEPLTVTFKGDFNPVIEDVNTEDELCLGSDITFDIVSKMPNRVDDPATFVLRKIKSYELYVIDSKGESQFGSTFDISANPDVTTSARITYSGEDTSISFYAKVTDEDDCTYNTNVVTVKINQFKITDVVVSNMNGDVMNTDDLCADIDYSYKAVLADGDGNVIAPGSNYDFTFTMDGVEWSDHSSGSYLLDSVVNSHPVTDGYISMVVNVINLTTGCKTDATLNLYKPYSENFKFHAKPEPDEKLIEDYQPVSSDSADIRKFEICSDEYFTFSVDGSDVTVVYDGKPALRFIDGVLAEVIDESTIPASSISPAAGADGNFEYEFSIKPSANFHTVSFIVSDGVCEVESNEWQFRKFEPVAIDAISVDGSNINDNGVVTVCEGYDVDFIPSTAEPNYNQGFNFYIDSVLVSPADFSALSYKFTGMPEGSYNLDVYPNFGSGRCHTSVTIEVKKSPVPKVTLGDLTPVAQSRYSWTYDFCEEQDLKLVLSGASEYKAFNFSIDGVPSDAFIQESGSGDAFEQIINLLSHQGGNGFSTYVFSVEYIVANCVEIGNVTFHVYNNPEAEFIDGTPKSLIIAGEQVPVSVTPGFANYEFIVNGDTLQSGPSNILAGDNNVIRENSTIEVVVSNDFGCETKLVANVDVLEGIEPKTITTSSDYYCSEDAGVRISVLDPQDGVTYELVNTNQTAKCVDGSDIYWEPVRVADPANVNPETFSVIAYYDQLPDQKFSMSNTVTVEEVKSPVDAVAEDITVQNCQTVQRPDFVWNVSAADTTNSYWLLTPDGTELGPVKPTSAQLAVPVYDLLFQAYGSTPNGNYKIIARTQRLYGASAGEFVCEKVLNGTLTIDIPTTEQFEVKMSPVNGNVCVDDLTGVDIYIDNSDYSDDFDHVYILYQDGVEVARKTSTADRGEIRFSNIVVNHVGNYVFSIVCEFSGCSQAMKNTQTLNVFGYPEQKTLTVDNDGFFCYDSNGATITVGGQQKGYLYRLFRNGYDSWTSTDASGAEVSVSYSHVGDDSNAPFSFSGIKEAGTYTVKVYIPAIDKFETSCVTELTDVIEVHPSPAPTQPDAHINKADRTTVGGKSLTVCADEAVKITLLQPEKWDLPNFEVHYRVFDENGNLVTETEVQDLSNSDRVVFADFTAQAVGLDAGVHSLTVVATQSRKLSDGSVLECVKEFEGVLGLYVKNRPSDGTESITVDTAPANPDNDPCYGVDLVVNNANTLVSDSVEYRLFIIDKLTGEASYVSSIKPYEGDEPRFKDIRNGNGDYFVEAYNGACADRIPPVPVHVEVDKYAAVQVLDVEDFMCQGDAGVSAGLIDSEENVIYRLFFVAPADWTRNFTQQELIDLHPGVMISEFNKATFDHQRVTFTGVNYQDGTPVTDLINQDGYYYVICIKDVPDACPVASPAVNFQSLKLPKSFNLMENRYYCDANGVQLYVEHSEVDPDAVITYRLYKKDEAGNLTFLSEIVSDGSDMLTFTNGNQELFVTEGTYAAIALKEYSIEINGKIKKHICTSALATEVEVKAAEPLDNLKFSPETLIACSDASAEFTLPAMALKEGIVYHLTDDSGNPEVASRQSLAYSGTGDVTFTNLVNGENVIWASYPNFDCVIEIGRVVLNHYPSIPQNYTGTVCGDNNLEVQICDERFLVNGLTYWLVDADGNMAAGPFDYDENSVDCVTFKNLTPQSYVLYGAFNGVNGDCETEMGVIEAVNPNASSSLYVAGQYYQPNATVEMCPDQLAMANIEVRNSVATKYIFYFKPDGAEAPDVVYEGANNACSLTEYLKNTAASGVLTFAIETVCGEYALPDYYVINPHQAIPQNYSDVVCGDNNLEAQICDSQYLINGLTYWLVDAEGNQAGSFVYDETSGECVTFRNLTPQTYVLYGAFNGVNGDCATEMGTIQVINPQASSSLYVAGEYYQPNDTVEMCPGLFAMANIEVRNAVASKYIFYFRPDGSAVSDVVYEGANNSCSLTEYLKNTAASGVLSFAFETVCGEFSLSDSYIFKIKGNGAAGNHLKATNDAKYCEGIPSVQLFYDDAKVGDIYRLYKVSSDSIVDPGDNNTFDDELMDIQEIPRNITNPSKTLYFNGWGYFNGENSSEDKDFASAGCYYVETTDNMGCTYISDLVCVEMSENPIAKSDSAFYAYQGVDGRLDESTFNTEFGYVEGVVALPNPKPGVNYYLVRDGEMLMPIDSVMIAPHITKGKNSDNSEYLVFGPIKPYLDEYPTEVVYRNDTIYAGEGVYQIMAVTDCESLSNPVTFIGEQLVAYDVEIYLNKNEISRIVDLIPSYDFLTHSSYKPNRRYIGWSSKIDRIYRPKVVTGNDGYYETDVTETELIDRSEDPYYFRDGYTNIKGTFKEEKSKVTYTGKSGASNVWFNIVQDPDNKVSGSYGFINVDYTPADSSVISMRTPSGYFYYMKQPSFYGQEKIQYYIENYQMPGRRSNIATITILCGNAETGDSTSVFLIPNAFSPNGDGFNDVFKIIIPDKYQDNSESKLQVFNRWGTLVYRSSGLKYGENEDWWDGTSSTSNMVTLGEKLPSGTYYYVFTISFIDKVHAVKSERKMHGFIELRR